MARPARSLAGSVGRSMRVFVACGILIVVCGCWPHPMPDEYYEQPHATDLLFLKVWIAWLKEFHTQRPATTAFPIWITASAHNAGANGTNWRTDVELLNPGGETVTLLLELLERDRDNSTPAVAEISVAPGTSVRLVDVLAERFGFAGSAALRFSPEASRVLVTSRTYNRLGPSNGLGLPAGSTFGQFIPSSFQAQATGAGQEGRLIHLSHDRSRTSGSRTNIALANATARNIVVDIDLYEAEGQRLGRVSTTLEPYEFHQLNRIFERVTSGPVPLGHAVVTTATPGGRFFALASVVDNLTGDPIAIGPARRAGPGQPLYIQAAAHLAGAAGTNWLTDVVVHNPGTAPATFTVELLLHGQANFDPESRTFTLEGGQSVMHADVLESMFSFSGKAALRFTATTGAIEVSSRTFNLLGSGNPQGLPAGATFGQYIAAIPVDQAVTFGVPGYLIQLSHDPDGHQGFRTNLGLVNATDSDVKVTLGLFTADGTSLGTVRADLSPFEFRQILRIFERVTSNVVEDGYVVVSTNTPGGRVFAQASVIDNLTGDPVAVGAAQMPTGVPDAIDVLSGGASALDLLRAAGAQGIGLQDLLAALVSHGPGPIFDRMVAADPAYLTRIQDGVRAQYRPGVEVADGFFLTGTETLAMRDLDVTGPGIGGSLVEDLHDLGLNGEPLGLEALTWTADLHMASDGSITGDMVVGTRPAATATSLRTFHGPSLDGSFHIDTAVCIQYPVSGSLVAQIGGRTVSIVLSEDCTGSYTASSDSWIELAVTQEEEDPYEPHLLWRSSSIGIISGHGMISQETRLYSALDAGVRIYGDNRQHAITITATTEGWPEKAVHRVDHGDGSFEIWTYRRLGLIVGYPPARQSSHYTLVIPAGALHWPAVTAVVSYACDHDLYDADGHLVQSIHGKRTAGRVTYTFTQTSS